MSYTTQPLSGGFYRLPLGIAVGVFAALLGTGLAPKLAAPTAPIAASSPITDAFNRGKEIGWHAGVRDVSVVSQAVLNGVTGGGSEFCALSEQHSDPELAFITHDQCSTYRKGRQGDLWRP